MRGQDAQSAWNLAQKNIVKICQLLEAAPFADISPTETNNLFFDVSLQERAANTFAKPFERPRVRDANNLVQKAREFKAGRCSERSLLGTTMRMAQKYNMPMSFRFSAERALAMEQQRKSKGSGAGALGLQSLGKVKPMKFDTISWTQMFNTSAPKKRPKAKPARTALKMLFGGK